MVKKLLLGFTSVLGIFSLNSFSYASEISYTFTDSSLIRSDISHLGLNDKDYCVIKDKDYNQTDIIALSESYIGSGNSKKIYNYVYFYNAYEIEDSFKSININYSANNNENSGKTKDVELEYISEDTSLHIIKYKFDFGTSSYEDILRNYTINSYTNKNGKTTTYDFKCTYNQSGSNVSFEYDSYIFITDKDLFDYMPNVNDNGEVENVDYSSNDGKQYFKFSSKWYEKHKYNGKWWQSLLNYNSYGSNQVAPDFFFLNFTTNKKIDDINEIDLSYKVYYNSDYDWYYGSGGHEYYKFLDSCDSGNSSEDSFKRELVKDYSDGNDGIYTIKKGSKEFLCDSLDDSSLKTIGSGSVSFDNFSIPSSNRLTDFSESKFYSRLTSDKLSNSSSGYSAKESFEKQQCSILIDILPYYCVKKDNWYGFIHTGSTNTFFKYSISDLSVMRINYNYNGTTYNARTNSGALISSSNANLVESSWFDTLIDWFADNFPTSLIIIGVIIIGLPMIFSLLVSLITSGGVSLISILGKLFMSIGKTIGKLITFIVRLFIKCITFILSLPFKLLGSLFKTNNSNNNKKK